MHTEPSRTLLRLLSSLLALAFSSAMTVAQESGTVEGACTLPPGTSAELVVVYLEGNLASPSSSDQRFQVEQRGVRFIPDRIVVPKGATIDFLNAEDRDITHNVFSRARGWQFDLGLYEPSVTRSAVFDRTGKILILCSIHREMRMQVFVTPSAYYVEPVEGRYRIEGIPPGEYSLHTWTDNRRIRPERFEVKIQPGQTTQHDIELQGRGR